MVYFIQRFLYKLLMIMYLRKGADYGREKKKQENRIAVKVDY